MRPTFSSPHRQVAPQTVPLPCALCSYGTDPQFYDNGEVCSFTQNILADSEQICLRAPATCGDGIIATGGAEECDDGNTAAGDGCDADCVIEAGYSCDGAPSTCTLMCGNGRVDAVPPLAAPPPPLPLAPPNNTHQLRSYSPEGQPRGVRRRLALLH